MKLNIRTLLPLFAIIFLCLLGIFIYKNNINHKKTSSTPIINRPLKATGSEKININTNKQTRSTTKVFDNSSTPPGASKETRPTHSLTQEAQPQGNYHLLSLIIDTENSQNNRALIANKFMLPENVTRNIEDDEISGYLYKQGDAIKNPLNNGDAVVSIDTDSVVIRSASGEEIILTQQQMADNYYNSYSNMAERLSTALASSDFQQLSTDFPDFADAISFNPNVDPSKTIYSHQLLGDFGFLPKKINDKQVYIFQANEHNPMFQLFGLQEGDIILSINESDFKDPSFDPELIMSATSDIGSDNTVVFEIERDGEFQIIQAQFVNGELISSQNNDETTSAPAESME